MLFRSIGTVIGAPTETSRDVETVKLLDYGFSLYRKRIPVQQNRAVVKVPVKYEDADLALVSKRSIPIGLQKDEEAKVTTVVPGEVEGPIKEGQRIGKAAVSVDGDLIGAVPLFAANAVEKPSLFDKAMDNILLLVIALIVVIFAILAVVAFVRRRRQSRMRRRLRRVTRYPG